MINQLDFFMYSYEMHFL